MSLLSRIFGKREERTITYQQGAAAGIVGPPSYSGMVVTEQTALGISPLWCGIRVISEGVGSLPPILYSDAATGRTPAKSHPLFHLLHCEPNPECTRPVLWETAQAHALLYGNAYLEIERNKAGQVLALWNVHPTRCRVLRDSGTGLLRYQISLSGSGGPAGPIGETVDVDADDMLHVPGLSPDGTVGYNLLKIARETIGFALGAQRFGCSLFRNLGRPGGVIDIPLGIKLDEQGRANLRRSFQNTHSGENVGSILVMEQGTKFSPLNLSTNEQMQYTQLLNFFVDEVSRLLNLQPTKIFSMGRATWGNLTELNRDFLTTTLRPWLEKWEAEIEKKLLLPSEKGKFFVEFDTSELLRADKTTRYAAYAVGLQAGFLTKNECRKEENLPPLPGGDDLPGQQPDDLETDGDEAEQDGDDQQQESDGK